MDHPAGPRRRCSSPNALYEVAKAACESGAELIYSDEVVLDSAMKRLAEYHFKPGLLPRHPARAAITSRTCAPSRRSFSAARAAARTRSLTARRTTTSSCACARRPKGVHHIPKVLHYWRGHAQSTAGDISGQALRPEGRRRWPWPPTCSGWALRARRPRIPGCPGAYRTRYAVTGEPRVSVLIPNKDHAEDLRRCLASIYKYGGWRNLEVIVIGEQLHRAAPPSPYTKRRAPRCRGCAWCSYQGPFNFSAINNTAARYATGQHLLLLNNDVEFTSPDSIREMLSYSQRPDVGAVGAKLLYPDGTVQHAGVIIGLGGSAGHSHKGHPGKFCRRHVPPRHSAELLCRDGRLPDGEKKPVRCAGRAG